MKEVGFLYPLGHIEVVCNTQENTSVPNKPSSPRSRDGRSPFWTSECLTCEITFRKDTLLSMMPSRELD